MKLRLPVPFGGITKRWLFNSLTLSLIIVMLGIVGYALATANYYYDITKSALENRATATANYFSRYVATGKDSYYARATEFAKSFQEHDKLEMQFINAYGRVEVSAGQQTVGYVPRTGDIQQALSTKEVSAWIGVDPLTKEQVLSVSAPLFFKGQEVIGVMRYVTSLSEVNRRIVIAIVTAVSIGVLLIAFTVVTNIYFIRSIVGPIQEINHIAKKVAAGSYGMRIEKVYDDEIGELADTINNMSADISGAERLKTDFISAISHELRTPLTAIGGWGEVLLATDASDVTEIHKGIRIMLKETTRLSKLVEELLDFTRMESGRMVMLMEPFDIAAELEEVVFMYMDSLSSEGIELRYEPPDEFPELVGDRSRLRQVFLNILDNAVKYGRDGRRIDVSLTLEGADVAITVQDYGQGISADELPLVKKKFYRGNTKARGTGIGLSISDEIIHMHDGSLDLTSVLGEGTRVTIRLPLTSHKPVITT